jgi:hypothetical protein
MLFPAAEAERAQDKIVELQGLLARLQERLQLSLAAREPPPG